MRLVVNDDEPHDFVRITLRKEKEGGSVAVLADCTPALWFREDGTLMTNVCDKTTLAAMGFQTVADGGVAVR